MRNTIFAGMITLSLLLSGCSGNYYLLTSKFVMSTQLESPPEIVETPTYKEQGAKIKTVAVKAPDSCSNRTADERSGVAESREAVLKTTCGVEMAEIERALSKASYRVISWKVLAREMEGKNVSALQVAKDLGAQILFQINSLEKSTRSLGKDARWERNYFTSDKYGEAREEKSFADDMRAYLKSSYLESYESSVNLKRLAVTLDANAVHVKDGESIWFYRWTLSDPAATDYQQTHLIYCDDEEKRECYPLAPEERSQQKRKTELMAAGESEAVSAAVKPEDQDKALYDTLLRSIVDNLVSNFAKSKQ